MRNIALYLFVLSLAVSSLYSQTGDRTITGVGASADGSQLTVQATYRIVKDNTTGEWGILPLTFDCTARFGGEVTYTGSAPGILRIRTLPSGNWNVVNNLGSGLAPYFTYEVQVGWSGASVPGGFSGTQTVTTGERPCTPTPYDLYVGPNYTKPRNLRILLVPSTGISGATLIANVTLGQGQVGHYTGMAEQCSKTVKIYEVTVGADDSVLLDEVSTVSTPPSDPTPDPDPVPAPPGFPDDAPPQNQDEPNPTGTYYQVTDKWNEANNAILKQIAAQTKYASEKLKSQVDAAKYANDRLKNIDTNIGLLLRNDTDRMNGKGPKLTVDLSPVVDAINGTTQTQNTFDSTGDSSVQSSASATAVSSILGKLPAAPVITNPQSESVKDFDFTLPGLSQTFRMHVDLAQYSTAIAIYKTIIRAALSVLFFYIAVKTIRSAFAG